MFEFGSRSATEHPHEAASLTEIWTSFGSLLRSYIAAAELGTPAPHAQVDVTSSTIAIRREQFGLVLDRAIDRWEFSHDQRVFAHGTFTLDADSRITWSGQLRPLELDQAAELITERFFDAEHEGDPDTEAEAAGEAGGE